MRLEEVQRLATKDSKQGNYWLIAKSYDQPEFPEAWHRIDQMRKSDELPCLDTVESQNHTGDLSAKLASLSETERVCATVAVDERRC